MTVPRFRSKTAVLAALLVPLGAWGAAAKHAPPPPVGVILGFTPLEAMPPAMATAYMVAIEEQLMAHGYDAGPPDGTPDRRSARVIRAYQRDAGLPVDGRASKELLDHLMFALPKIYAGRGWADPAPGGSNEQRGPAGRSTQRGAGPGYRPDPVIVEPLPDLPKTAPVTPGEDYAAAAGGVVSQVQGALKRRGYYDGPVDGTFNAGTGAAIHRFQQDWGLPESGVIDSPLLGVLRLENGGSYDL